jgi:hypothetical protein
MLLKWRRKKSFKLLQTANGPGGGLNLPVSGPVPTVPTVLTTPVKAPKISFAMPAPTPTKSATKRGSSKDEDTYLPGQAKQQPYLKYQNNQVPML